MSYESRVEALDRAVRVALGNNMNEPPAIIVARAKEFDTFLADE